MSCSSHDLLALAKRLQGLSNGSEVISRCVTSRAYYAALHEVESTFDPREDKYRVDGESSHREIIGRATAYGNQLLPGRTDAALIAKTITRLRRERNKADYDIYDPYLVESSDDVVVRSELVLKLCRQVAEKRLGKTA